MNKQIIIYIYIYIYIQHICVYIYIYIYIYIINHIRAAKPGGASLYYIIL